MTDEQVKELIVRRRRQIMVNSCIYYEYGKSIISDKQFDKWAYELVDLQDKYPEIAKTSEWSFSFVDFDGTTGFDLPLTGLWVNGRAQQLIDYAEKNGLLI